MKFTKKLSAHLTPEWRKQYINYERLKEILITAVDKLPVEKSMNQRHLRSYYAGLDEEFLQECEKELTKVNTFYAEKLAEAKRKFADLKEELSKALRVTDRQGRVTMEMVKLPKNRIQQQKLAFSEFYLSLVLLQNYQNLNYTGFRKILKKHDKLLHTDSGAAWFEKYVDNAFFYNNKDLLNIIHEVEITFTNYMEGGDRGRAMKRLRVPPLGNVHYPWPTFRLGLFMGAMLVLFVVAYISFMRTKLTTNTVACERLFRGPLMLIVFIFLIGINIFGWRAAGVNHVLIFEIDPRNNLSGVHVMEMAAGFAVLWALCLLSFLYSMHKDMQPLWYPLGLLLIMLAFLLNPLKICHYSSRIWLIKLVGRLITAPLHHVGFADFWLGDQLNSLTACLVDYEYILCFYMTNNDWANAVDPERCMEKDFIIAPIVRCLPAWFRFAQCLRRYRDTRKACPFLVNAGKYATTFFVVLFATLMRYYKTSFENTFDSPYVWGYLVSYTVSTVYCYAWDMIRDFGVFKKFSGENIFLREQIVYNANFYYFAIIEDFLLRLTWVPAFYLVEQDLIGGYNMSTITGFLEVIRRYIWNYFRLENEHLFNAGAFRAVRDISLSPIEPKDQIALQRMMDEVDGVQNRQNSLDETLEPSPTRPKIA